MTYKLTHTSYLEELRSAGQLAETELTQTPFQKALLDFHGGKTWKICPNCQSTVQMDIIGIIYNVYTNCHVISTCDIITTHILHQNAQGACGTRCGGLFHLVFGVAHKGQLPGHVGLELISIGTSIGLCNLASVARCVQSYRSCSKKCLKMEKSHWEMNISSISVKDQWPPTSIGRWPTASLSAASGGTLHASVGLGPPKDSTPEASWHRLTVSGAQIGRKVMIFELFCNRSGSQKVPVSRNPRVDSQAGPASPPETNITRRTRSPIACAGRVASFWCRDSNLCIPDWMALHHVTAKKTCSANSRKINISNWKTRKSNIKPKSRRACMAACKRCSVAGEAAPAPPANPPERPVQPAFCLPPYAKWAKKVLPGWQTTGSSHKTRIVQVNMLYYYSSCSLPTCSRPKRTTPNAYPNCPTFEHDHNQLGSTDQPAENAHHQRVATWFYCLVPLPTFAWSGTTSKAERLSAGVGRQAPGAGDAESGGSNRLTGKNRWNGFIKTSTF